MKSNAQKTFRALLIVFLSIALLGLVATFFDGSSGSSGGTAVIPGGNNMPTVQPEDKPEEPPEEAPEDTPEDLPEELPLDPAIPADAIERIITDRAVALHYPSYPQEPCFIYENDGVLHVDGDASSVYFSIRLYDDPEDPRLMLYSYDYMSIEFDVSTVESYDPFKTSFYILGREWAWGPAYNYSGTSAKIYVANDQLIQGSNKDDSKLANPTDKIHVKYVIQVNEENQTADFHLFFNDELFSSVRETLSETKNSIEEIRFSGIKGYGKLSFTNLLVKGYVKQ